MTDNENKPDQEIIDAAEFDSDIPPSPYEVKDVLDEEGDDEDEGIFAPIDARKKKSGSKTTAVAVVLIALLGGGAFYYFNQGNLNGIMPVQPTAAPAAPEMETPPEVATDSSASITSPESVPTSSVPPADVPPPVENTTAISAPANIEDAPTPTEEVSTPPSAEMDKPPTIEEATAKSATETPVVSAEAEKLKSVVPVSDVSTPDVTDLESAKISEVGDNPQLAPPPVENTGATEQEKQTDKTDLEIAGETINTAPKKETPIKYYDSPGDKALRDIPPPSINPMTEPGQSIIIVHKDRTVPAHEAIIEKGDDSQMVESRITSANRASRIGKDDAAIDFYNEAFKKNPNDPRILMGRAVSYQKVGETEKAIQGYKDVLQIDPNNPEALTNLMGLVGQKKPAVALQNLLTLREKYPRNASVAAQLGVAYAQSGNQEDGLKYLNIAAGLQPENPLHYYNMAVISDRLGDREKAIQYYEQSLDVYSVNGSGADTDFSREKIYDRLSQLRGSN